MDNMLGLRALLQGGRWMGRPCGLLGLNEGKERLQDKGLLACGDTSEKGPGR